MNSPSSGWGSALPSGSTTESTCSCFCVSFEEIRPDSRLLPPPPPPLTSHKHTCLLLHPALNEVTGQFALLLPTRQRLKITHVRRNERMISACCLPLTFHVFPAWHHEYIAVYVLFLFFLNNIQHIKWKEKKSGGSEMFMPVCSRVSRWVWICAVEPRGQVLSSTLVHKSGWPVPPRGCDTKHSKPREAGLTHEGINKPWITDGSSDT